MRLPKKYQKSCCVAEVFEDSALVCVRDGELKFDNHYQISDENFS